MLWTTKSFLQGCLLVSIDLVDSTRCSRFQKMRVSRNESILRFHWLIRSIQRSISVSQSGVRWHGSDLMARTERYREGTVRYVRTYANHQRTKWPHGRFLFTPRHSPYQASKQLLRLFRLLFIFITTMSETTWHDCRRATIAYEAKLHKREKLSPSIYPPYIYLYLIWLYEEASRLVSLVIVVRTVHRIESNATTENDVDRIRSVTVTD
jgi:hypothetical protein